MKRRSFIILLLAVYLLLCIPAAAVSSADGMAYHASVAADGSCHVTLTVELNLEATQSEHTFPVPAAATDVKLGGSPAKTELRDGKQLLLLEVASGSYTANISYTLPNVVRIAENTGTVTLELLSGFDHPIASLEFTVELPGAITAAPSYTSGYHQENIAASISATIEEGKLHGFVHGGLKDHETLTLSLTADGADFHHTTHRAPLLSAWEWAILGTIALAAIYYLFTLMPKLTRRTRCFGIPDGISAGELGTCLTGCGTDLTMLVISWAQLGYLTIEIDREDHVTLRKRMEMGNERHKLEMRCYHSLFDNRTMVDGTGLHYAQICRKMAGKSTLLRQMYNPHSGSPRLFRLLMTIPGVILGVQMGVALGNGSGTKTVFAIAIALLCAVLSYFIQSGGKCLPLRDKTPLLLCLICGLLWMAPAIAAGKLAAAIGMVILQFISGVAAAYGGKRSELGVRSLAQIRGLRHHLRTAKTGELQQLMAKNPDYFYELAPYALALGLDRRFARRFGKMQLPESSYLDIGTNRPVSATQWAAELRYAANILNKRQKRLAYEQFQRK